MMCYRFVETLSENSDRASVVFGLGIFHFSSFGFFGRRLQLAVLMETGFLSPDEVRLLALPEDRTLIVLQSGSMASDVSN